MMDPSGLFEGILGQIINLLTRRVVLMPSTLYQSVKKSVIEFAQLKKKNQKLQDKLIFRWKLITLGLSIIFIILVGAFSQVLKAVNALPDQTSDQSFILPLLRSANDVSVSTVKNANNLINGITKSLENSGSEYQWNKANLIFQFSQSATQTTIDINALVQAINSKSNLVFIISQVPTTPPPPPPLPALSRFGFFARHSYSESSAGVASVSDDSDSRYSTFFNLDTNAAILSYDASGCDIYTRDANGLTLFNSFAIKTSGTITVGVVSDKFQCFKAQNITDASNWLGVLTSLDPTTFPFDISIGSLQVFQLSLDTSL